MIKRITAFCLISFLFAFSGVAIAVDTPVAPAAVAAVADKPVAAVEPAVTVAPSDDPLKDAEKVIDDGIKKIDENLVKEADTLVQMIEEGRWGPLVGLILMFLIWALRKYIWKLIPKNVLPWVTLGVGILTTGATELILGVTWWKVLIDSFTTSASAMALWSLIFKRFMKPKEATEESKTES